MTADPQTTNLGYFVPLNGADVGTWDQPMNANYLAIDNTFSTVSTISLASGNNVTLSTPIADSSSWSANQSQSALLRFTGGLPNNVVVTLPRPGFWLVENLCANTGAFVVQLRSTASGGNVICAPPGEMVQVFNDGTNCKYIGMGRVGELMDLTVSAIPAWISGCTVRPYLNCDGTTFTQATYPALFALLGSATLPDIRGRGRVSLNQGTDNYKKANGVDGDTLFASGGTGAATIAQANLPAYNLTVTDPGHAHTYTSTQVAGFSVGPGPPPPPLAQTTGTTSTARTGITVNLNGGAQPINVLPPVFVSGLTLIRAA